MAFQLNPTRLSILADTVGLRDLTQQLKIASGNEHGHSPEAVFSAQQSLLSNIMLVSALLLGFIVTGTMLSIGATGSENYGITELINFFGWSSLAATFAFLSLIVSFLTSVWGANFMTSHGPVEAAKAITRGSVLRHIMAEGALYMSMFFFLVSLDTYVRMVYSGPDICPSYRGSAADCARYGERLFQAAAGVCTGRCEAFGTSECTSNTDMRSCLCEEFCNPIWRQHFNWTQTVIQRPAGVSVMHFHWFGYWSPGTPQKPRREKVITEAAIVMCHREVLQAKKEQCFRENSQGCVDAFLAWDKSEECVEDTKQNIEKCAKVCSWSGNCPPREAMARTSKFIFLPLGAMLLVLTLGRTILIMVRAYRACHEQQTVLSERLLVPADASSEESSSSQSA